MSIDTIAQDIERGMAEERARTAPPPGFPKLPPIPGERYTDPGFQTLEHEQLWKRSWVYACHADEVPEPGSFMLWRNLGSPILIIRGRDDKVRAFYNTCRHRGGPLVKEDAGKRNTFVCGYHGWTYDPTGKLIGIRDERDFPDFDAECLGLISVRCETFGNWIFLNLDDDAEPLLDYLGPIADEWAQYEPDKIKLADKRTYDINCNVKVLLDAFLEVYHLKSIHQRTVDRFLDHAGTTITLWPKGHSRMSTPNRRPDWVDPGTVGLPEIPSVHPFFAVNNISYNVFPNIVTPPAPTGIPFAVFWPLTDNTMRLEVHWFSPPWGDGELPEVWKVRLDNFERILEEDTQFAPQIQESVESDGFKGVILNYQERRIYHWHEELDRRIGANAVPEAARVKPMLGSFIAEPGAARASAAE